MNPSSPLKFTSYVSFPNLKDRNYIYLDNTKLISKIAKQKGPFVLVRPRNFGKTTLICAFEELFEHGVGQFKGLAIEHLWKDTTYKVIHLDFIFNKLPDPTSEFLANFNYNLKSSLCSLEPDIFKSDNGDTPAKILEKVLKKHDNLVLLVDEFDVALTNTLHDEEMFNDRLELLSDFFNVIQRYLHKFRFIFMAGNVNIFVNPKFSQFNSYIDLSTDSEYGDLIGFTEEAIRTCCSENLNYAARELNEDTKTQAYTKENVLELMKEYYGGYYFVKAHKHQVLCPWDVMNFLDHPKESIHSYWIKAQCSKNEFLSRYLAQRIKQSNDPKTLHALLDLDYLENRDRDSLFATVEPAKQDLYSIVYQLGYLCIKGSSDKYYKIGLPNLEVKKAYADRLLELLTTKDDAKIRYTISFHEALSSGDVNNIKEVFNSFLNELSYEPVKNFDEECFKDVLKLAMLTVYVTASTEVMGDNGTADITAEAGDYLYVFELKVTDNSKDIATKLNDAKAQIIKNNYARPLTDKIVVPIALVLENNSKNREKSDTPVCQIIALEKVDNLI